MSEFAVRRQLAALTFQMVSLIGVASQEEERSGFIELAKDQTFTDMVEYMNDQIKKGRLVLQKLRN